MKRFIAFLALISLALSASAQINEIKNLYFSQWYDYPYNFFTLNWETPDPGTDTLQGYRIYRNNELYKTQTENSLFHLPTGSNSSDTFLSFNNSSFYIHVVAVYNHDSLASTYSDSTLCYGLALGVKNDSPVNYPEIESTICHSALAINNCPQCKITMLDLSGRPVLNQETPQSKHTEINISKLTPGYYLLLLNLENSVQSFKILKI